MQPKRHKIQVKELAFLVSSKGEHQLMLSEPPNRTKGDRQLHEAVGDPGH